MFEEITLKQCDLVQILTTRNVMYLSAPHDMLLSPKGVWSVVAVVNNNEVMLSKNSIIIRIPVSDVLKVADHNIFDVGSILGRLSEYGKRRGQEEKTSGSGKSG